MKFGKIMQNQLDDTIPEWREKFLCYKQLKKRLKSLQAPVCFTKAAFAENTALAKEGSHELDEVYNDGRGEKRLVSDSVDSDASDEGPSPMKRRKRTVDEAVEELSAAGAEDANGVLSNDENTNEEARVALRMAKDKEFIRLLNVELDKFNNFFMEKEEEYVIRLHQLKERIEAVKGKYSENGNACDQTCEEECTRIQRDIVTFHGEMVLLENYSSLNYMGLVKILKKHDKRTGAVLRMPFIVSVLHQPFFSTKLLSKLVLECAECDNSIKSILPPSTTNEAVVEEGVIEDASLSRAMESEPIHRQTLAALRTIQAMRKA
ncbi:hypothetical protein R1flu_022070 [Riccia fluitans]|uniref:SPX domain-containing protein n=1 Tax=Riccia fluitans TaxID=41844 RepID=A0ABD1ZR64_9MARC